MGLLLWIIFGALVGWIASIIMGTNKEQGGLANIGIGIVGAIIGGFVARLLGYNGVAGFNVLSFIIALVGSILLIMIVRMFSRQM